MQRWICHVFRTKRIFTARKLYFLYTKTSSYLASHKLSPICVATISNIYFFFAQIQSFVYKIHTNYPSIVLFEVCRLNQNFTIADVADVEYLFIVRNTFLTIPLRETYSYYNIFCFSHFRSDGRYHKIVSSLPENFAFFRLLNTGRFTKGDKLVLYP